MRTNIEIDADLIQRVMIGYDVKTRREAVDRALRQALRVIQQQAIRELRGSGWEGDLDAMRTDKPLPPHE